MPQTPATRFLSPARHERSRSYRNLPRGDYRHAQSGGPGAACGFGRRRCRVVVSGRDADSGIHAVLYPENGGDFHDYHLASALYDVAANDAADRNDRVATFPLRQCR